ncbi:N-acetylmuramoyl-L-alanine amidase, partial [Psychrobacter sp. T6-1]
MAKNFTALALATFLSLPLIGCITTPQPQMATTETFRVDSDTYQSQGKSERIKTIVLHYTVS